MILMREIKKPHKETEKYAMFSDWENQYCENDYTTQSTLNAIPIKLPMTFSQN